ncbi:MAG: hypothetical protein E2604_10030 [Flavobacterium sp.]|jgi:hypothetical protein|nr:hypothetical protein [Flavobacterium sp.]
MDRKLTLKLDKEVIEKAKEYASRNKKSLSRIIESYLQSLTSDNPRDNSEEIKISPFVKELSQPTSLPEDFDYKKELGNHYSEKHQ